MMKTRLFLSILVLTLSISFHAAGNIVFYADFEPGSKEIKPNAAVNDVKNYKPENAGTIWAESDFNGGDLGGEKAMAQTAEGCDKSGNTPLPGVNNFTDGIIQVIFSFGDDDSFGVQFRRKGDDKAISLSSAITRRQKSFSRISQMGVAPPEIASTSANVRTAAKNCYRWITA